MEQYRGTTILSYRRDGQIVIGGDGQVSLGDTVMKSNAKKVRRFIILTTKSAMIPKYIGACSRGFRRV